MQTHSRSSVRRPFLYLVAGVLAVAVSLPLAISSGQTSANGLFDECLGNDCSATLIAQKLD